MTNEQVRPGEPSPAAPKVGYVRVDSPVGPVYLAYTERGVLFVSATAASDEAFLDELRERFGHRLDGVQIERGDARARARWHEAFRAWVEEGEVPSLDLRWVTPFERRVMEAV